MPGRASLDPEPLRERDDSRGIRRWLRVAPRPLGVLAFVGWCTVIFVISGKSAPDLGPSFRPFGAWGNNLMHAPEYAIFACLWLWATARKGAAWTAGAGRIALVVGAVLVYALSDEWHQSFTLGRDASVCDILTDLCGGATAALLVRAIETAAPRARTVRIAATGVLACALAALIATFVPTHWPAIGWL